MRRVLIAEPDTAFREALGDAVRNAGWYADAAPALDARTPRELGEYSAALVSIEPPGAAVAIGRLGAACAPLAVIAMGPADPPGPAVEALANGAREFLRKPFDVAALEAALANALDPARRSGAPPGVELLTRDPGVRRLLREAEAAAATDATVLVLGESGSGRSRLAQWIHTRSRRADAPVVFVRGGALATDAECELFGDGEGADCGLLGAVRGGTLVLEDVGELPLEIQARLVRRMQDGGEGTPLRVVATSKRPLANEVACGRLRPDLHHRLEVLVLRVPPLRERPRDIEWLAQLLLERAARARGAPTPRLSRGALDVLVHHAFPGNVRELENLTERAVLLFAGREVDVERLLDRGQPAAPLSETLNLRDLERQAVVRSLALHHGNRTRASQALGISVRTLRNKIRSYGLA